MNALVEDRSEEGGEGRSKDVDLGMLPGLLGYNLRRALERAFHDFAAAMAPWDITPGQLGVMVIVRANEGMNQQRLANALGIDRSTMSGVLDALERRRLIARKPSPRDRRSHALELTAAGRDMLEELLPAHRAHEARIAAGLDAGERRDLLRLLQKLNG